MKVKNLFFVFACFFLIGIFSAVKADPVTYTIQEISSTVSMPMPGTWRNDPTTGWNLFYDQLGNLVFREKSSLGMPPVALTVDTDLMWFGNYGQVFKGSVNPVKEYQVCDSLGRCAISKFVGSLTSASTGFLNFIGSFTSVNLGGNLLDIKLITNNQSSNIVTKDGGASIPEPLTLLTLGSGLAALAALGRRRKKT